MASEDFSKRYRTAYAKLIRLYPAAYRERFGEGMRQTFNDLCRERAKAGRGVFSFALWTFFETFAAIIEENGATLLKNAMKANSLTYLKYAAIAICALMMAGIVTLMILARGKGEDIAGIVAMALLIVIVSAGVAITATVLQRRARKALGKP